MVENLRNYQLSRRQFLKTSGIASAGIIALPGLLSSKPSGSKNSSGNSRVFRVRPVEGSRTYPAFDKLCAKTEIRTVRQAIRSVKSPKIPFVLGNG